MTNQRKKRRGKTEKEIKSRSQRLSVVDVDKPEGGIFINSILIGGLFQSQFLPGYPLLLSVPVPRQ